MHVLELLKRLEGAQVSLPGLLSLIGGKVPVLPFPPGMLLPVAIFPSVRVGGGHIICGKGSEFWREHGLTDKPWALSYLRNGFNMAPIVNNIPCIGIISGDISAVLWIASLSKGMFSSVEYWTWDYARWVPDAGPVRLVPSDVLHRWMLAGKRTVPAVPYPITGTLRRAGNAYVIDWQLQVYLHPSSNALYLDIAPWVPASTSSICQKLSCFFDSSLRIYISIDEFDEKYGRGRNGKGGSEEAAVGEEGEGDVGEDYGVEEEAPEEEDDADEREEGAGGE